MRKYLLLTFILIAYAALNVGGCGGSVKSDLISVATPASWNATSARTPKYLHLGYEENPDHSVTFQWQTEDRDETTYIPKVWFVHQRDVRRADPKVYDAEIILPYARRYTAAGQVEHYCNVLMCTEEAEGGVMDGRQWRVKVDMLEPDSVYYYRVGTWESFDEATGVFTGADLSPVYHFRTATRVGSAQPFSFGFGSDSQGWWPDVSQRLVEIRSDTGKETRFWLLGGDLTDVNTQERMWDWFDAFAPLLHYLPVMPTKGNHEIFAQMYYGQFTLPRMADLTPDLHEFLWSMDAGNVHIVAYDGNSKNMVESYVPWMDADLAAARARPGIDWIVVYAHQPAYSSSNHGGADYIVEHLAPLFDAHHVDLSLSGHDHNYERSKPLKGGEVVADASQGTVYVVAGGFYSQKYYSNGESFFTELSVDGSRNDYLIFSVNGKVLVVTAYTGAHEVIDTFTLDKRGDVKG